MHLGTLYVFFYIRDAEDFVCLTMLTGERLVMRETFYAWRETPSQRGRIDSPDISFLTLTIDHALTGRRFKS